MSVYVYFSIYCQFITIFIFLSKVDINKGRTEYTFKKSERNTFCGENAEYKILCKLLMFVAAETNLISSYSLITLAEADDYSQQSLETC